MIEVFLGDYTGVVVFRGGERIFAVGVLLYELLTGELPELLRAGHSALSWTGLCVAAALGGFRFLRNEAQTSHRFEVRKFVTGMPIDAAAGIEPAPKYSKRTWSAGHCAAAWRTSSMKGRGPHR